MDSLISLINAVNDLKITSSPNENMKKIEECRFLIMKYAEKIPKISETDTHRGFCSMDELSETGITFQQKRQQRQMSTEVFGSSCYNKSVEEIGSCPPVEVINSLKYLWSTPSIQKAYERRNEFQLIDSASYFLDDLDRICRSDYDPKDEDILRTRVRTTGIVKIEFEFRHLTVSEIFNAFQ